VHIAKLAKNCALQGRKFAQKLRSNPKFAKNEILRERAKLAQKLRPATLRFSSGAGM